LAEDCFDRVRDVLLRPRERDVRGEENVGEHASLLRQAERRGALECGVHRPLEAGFRPLAACAHRPNAARPALRAEPRRGHGARAELRAEPRREQGELLVFDQNHQPPIMTVGSPLTMTPPCAVWSPMRAAGRLLIITVIEPLMITSGGAGGHSALSVTRAAGRNAIMTSVEHGGRVGPPAGGVGGTARGALGRGWMAGTGAAGGLGGLLRGALAGRG